MRWQAAYPTSNIHCTHLTHFLFLPMTIFESSYSPGIFSRRGSKVVCFGQSGGRGWCDGLRPRPAEASHRGVMRSQKVKGADPDGPGRARQGQVGRSAGLVQNLPGPPRAGKCRKGKPPCDSEWFVGMQRDPHAINPRPNLPRILLAVTRLSGRDLPPATRACLHVCMPTFHGMWRPSPAVASCRRRHPSDCE